MIPPRYETWAFTESEVSDPEITRRDDVWTIKIPGIALGDTHLGYPQDVIAMYRDGALLGSRPGLTDAEERERTELGFVNAEMASFEGEPFAAWRTVLVMDGRFRSWKCRGCGKKGKKP